MHWHPSLIFLKDQDFMLFWSNWQKHSASYLIEYIFKRLCIFCALPSQCIKKAEQKFTFSYFRVWSFSNGLLKAHIHINLRNWIRVHRVLSNRKAISAVGNLKRRHARLLKYIMMDYHRFSLQTRRETGVVGASMSGNWMRVGCLANANMIFWRVNMKLIEAIGISKTMLAI